MANKNFKVRQGLEAPLIAADDGTTAITLSNNDVTVVGDLTVTSNTIKSSSATALTLSGANVAVAGTLDVQGGTITDSTGALSITPAGALILTPGTSFTSTGSSISGTTLTIGTLVTGTIAVGAVLSGGTILSGTVITANISGSGSGSTWTVSPSQTVASSSINGSGNIELNSANITTTATTANLFNTTATTLNIGGAATLAVNIGTANGSILKGSNRSPFTSPTITAFTGTVAPSRGLLLNNGNGASAALARNNLVLRTYPTSGGARGGVLFENARGTENVPTAVQSGDLIAELNATGYATNGFISDYVASLPALSYFTPTENWANTGGPYPTAGTVTNAGSGYIMSLQPTATNLSASSRVTVLSINPQTFACRSDAFTWANGKTGTTQTMALDVSGNLTVSNKLSTSGSTFDNTLAVDAQTNLLDTNTTSGTSLAIQTNYWTSSAKTTRTVPQSGNKLGNFRWNSYSDTAGTFVLGSQVSVEATENWTSTANGSKIQFFANKQGQSWTPSGQVQVASFQPESSSFSSDVFTIENSAGTDFVVIDANTAKFNVPVTTEITTTTISEGTTYTPAATVDNNISVQINTLAGGTTVIDLASLTGNSRGASYNILVFNNTASGTPIQVKNTRINTNNLMTHTITAGDRIIINAYVVGDYATATHFVVA